MKKLLLSIVAILALAPAVKAWNGPLHAAVASIADANLTAEARKNIEAALDNHSIVYYAHWMDDVAKTEGYTHVTKWHNVPLTAKDKIIPAKKAAKSKSDAIKNAMALDALERAIAAIENRGAISAEELKNNIRYVIYIMGDLHCPSHYVFADLLEQRSLKYYYGNEKKARSYMRFWESDAIAGTFNWRPNEFVHQLNRLSPEQVAALTEGSVSDWVVRNAKTYREIYTYLTPDTRFKKADYRIWLNKSYGMATDQIGVAGYRLAAVLNGLFDNSTPKKSVK